MNKYIVEFIGTFFLMLAIVMCANNPDIGNLAPLGIGAMLIGVIYAGGHISKAHYNPAVTIAFWIRGGMERKDVLPYLIAEVAGALAATFIGLFLLDANEFTTSVGSFSDNLLAGIIGEVLGTFALVFVILNVATAQGTKGNGFYGVAIGFVVIGCAYSFGSLTGGAYNPAVALGNCIAGMQSWGEIWAIVVANFVGGILATYAFLLTNRG